MQLHVDDLGLAEAVLRLHQERELLIDHQRRDHRDDRQAELHDDQHLAQHNTGKTLDPHQPFQHTSGHVRGHLERRIQPRQHPDTHSKANKKQKKAAIARQVDRHTPHVQIVLEPLQVVEAGHQPDEQEAGKHQRQKRHDDGFTQKLPDDLPPLRPDDLPDPNLPRPFQRPRHRQADVVENRNQDQDEPEEREHVGIAGRHRDTAPPTPRYPQQSL